MASWGMGQGLDQDNELVAAQAGNSISRALTTLQRASGGDQELIADQMTQAVVDIFKAIQIDEQDRKRSLSGVLLALDGMLEPIQKQVAIGQAGQGIVQGLVAQALFRQLTVGDIGLRANQTDGMAGRIPDGQPATEHPAIATVLMQDTILDLQAINQPLDMRRQMGLQQRAVIGVEPIQPFGGASADRGLGITKHSLPACREEDLLTG